jgi:hypothetical protein
MGRFVVAIFRTVPSGTAVQLRRPGRSRRSEGLAAGIGGGNEIGEMGRRPRRRRRDRSRRGRRRAGGEAGIRRGDRRTPLRRSDVRRGKGRTRGAGVNQSVTGSLLPACAWTLVHGRLRRRFTVCDGHWPLASRAEGPFRIHEQMNERRRAMHPPCKPAAGASPIARRRGPLRFQRLGSDCWTRARAEPACVLYPASIRDLLIRLARTGLFRARWTDRILDECFTSIVADRPDLEGKLDRTRRLMEEAIADALIGDYQPLVDGLVLPTRTTVTFSQPRSGRAHRSS